MKKPIYLLDHKIKFDTFSRLEAALVRDAGPVPVGGSKVLWELLKEKKIYCWYDPYVRGDMRIGLKLPKRRIEVITDGRLGEKIKEEK